jgi:hypothetical protein
MYHVMSRGDQREAIFRDDGDGNCRKTTQCVRIMVVDTS